MKKLILSLMAVAALFAVALCGCNSESLYQGEFYSLQQAYDAGWLTQDDLKSIAYYHNGGTEGNEEVMGEDYQPQPKTPEVLDGFTERSIKQSYIDKFLTDKNAKISNVNLDSYYGSYNDCFALMVSDTYSGTTGEITLQTVCNVKFYYNSGNQIKIWRATFSGIDEALAKQIKADYTKNSKYDSSELMLSVYGEYSGTYVMFIDGPWDYMDVITTETVDGVVFVYGSSRTLRAYKGGEFYSLEQAYENEFLTHNDLLDINVKYQTNQFKIY